MNFFRRVLYKMGVGHEDAGQSYLRVFLLDDDESRHEWFMKRFAKDQLDIAKDVGGATSLLSERSYDAIFLDHDLLPEHYNSETTDDERTGYAVALWLALRQDLQPASTIVVHTRNADGAMRMVAELRRAGRQADYVPFPFFRRESRATGAGERTLEG
ncbi:MAG: cyclic-phosphate processing receiver domain-containing protein [Pyrinomonadaceae bacterium]